jgi:hypothetical protein
MSPVLLGAPRVLIWQAAADPDNGEQISPWFADLRTSNQSDAIGRLKNPKL